MSQVIKLTKPNGEPVDVDFNFVVSRENKPFNVEFPEAELSDRMRLQIGAKGIDPVVADLTHIFCSGFGGYPLHLTTFGQRDGNYIVAQTEICPPQKLTGAFLHTTGKVLVSTSRSTVVPIPHTKHSTSIKDLNIQVVQTCEQIDEALKSGKDNLHADRSNPLPRIQGEFRTALTQSAEQHAETLKSAKDESLRWGWGWLPRFMS